MSPSPRTPVHATPEARALRAAMGLRQVLGAYLELLRPRVAVMVALMALLGALQAGQGQLGASLEAALYITLVTGCASVLNQVLERDTDALMPRTQDRPLVTGRVEPAKAVAFAVLLGVLGTLGLLLRFNLLSAFLTLATLVTYVAVYTPLKRLTVLNTAVGAIPGAAPPLLGYAALAGQLGPWAWCLFAVLFAWQFPHFMGIAWLYRGDYEAAGHRMMPCGPGAEGLAGRQAVLYAVALLPVALLPALSGMAGVSYALGTAVISVAYLVSSVRFLLREDRARARELVLVSLVYLPLWFTLVLLDPVLPV